MKGKHVYINVSVFILFVASLFFFSNTTKKSNEIQNARMQNGNGSSRTNMREEASARMNAIKAEYEKNPNDTLKTREYADILYAHKPNEAIELYEKILKQDPKRKDILYQLTFVYFNMGDIQKAEEYNNRVLNIDKDNPIGNYNRAGIAQVKGDSKKAKAIWQDLAKKYPNTDVGYMAGQLAKQLDQIPPKK